VLNTKTAVNCLLTSVLLTLSSLPSRADDKSKDEETFRNASVVLQAMLDAKTVPETLLAKADCVIVLPGVKKGAFIVGGTGGRGPMSCRSGKNFSGKWSAPAMYSIGGASIGMQVGGSSTDFVLLIMAPTAVDSVLQGKTKIGGATSAGSVGGADILTYGRASGLFAGMSLSGASLSPDNDANERLYGKSATVRDIVMGGTVKPSAGGKSLISLLNGSVPAHGD
jgi:SH3 domain-containing YSC84-like protein 1